MNSNALADERSITCASSTAITTGARSCRAPRVASSSAPTENTLAAEGSSILSFSGPTLATCAALEASCETTPYSSATSLSSPLASSTTTSSRVGRARRKNAVLPMPASPSIDTICGLDASDASSAEDTRFDSASRPTKTLLLAPMIAVADPLDPPGPDLDPAPESIPKKRGGGPRTPEGRERSKRNALKHGLLAQVVFPDDLAGRRVTVDATVLQAGACVAAQTGWAELVAHRTKAIVLSFAPGQGGCP